MLLYEYQFVLVNNSRTATVDYTIMLHPLIAFSPLLKEQGKYQASQGLGSSGGEQPLHQ
jgi:hypothetical protein